jgi:hypothetical protein
MVPSTAVDRRTFVAEARQRQFERDGWVVVDLLDDEALDRLRTGYLELDHAAERSSAFAQGFHATAYDLRPAYRAAVRDLIDGATEPARRSTFVDHQAFFANFLVKQPGADLVDRHIDWTFVDEDRFRSAMVWCPLDDVDADGGAMGGAPGTQDHVAFVRPVNHRDQPHHASLVVHGGTEQVIALRAGQAVVMDSRVVHFSAPNSSGRERVVAAFVVAPHEAELVHWWVAPDGVPVRYVVRPEFYLSYVVGEPPERVAGIVSGGAVPGTPIA